LAGRRTALQEAMDQHGFFSQTASHFGGTSFWVNGPDWLDSRKLATLARDKGVLIEPGDVFFQPQNPPLNFFRMSYSAISTEKIGEGVARLAAVIKDMAPAD
jgi:GntR family transcriptional regulator/MocR family aminotransferase